MKRIDSHSVELTPTEMKASFRFERLLDDGLGIDAAINQVRRTYWWANLSDEFFEWLR